MKFDHGQRVNPLFTLLSAKLYFFSNYVWYYSNLKKKKKENLYIIHIFSPTFQNLIFILNLLIEQL